MSLSAIGFDKAEIFLFVGRGIGIEGSRMGGSGVEGLKVGGSGVGSMGAAGSSQNFLSISVSSLFA